MAALPDGRIFIIGQPGRVRVLRSGSLSAAPFLDVTSRVEAGGEEGLLGLAFHPQFAQNRRLFVNYTRRVSGQLQSITSEFTASSTNPDTVDPSTERILLTVNKTFGNHNGGQIAFGPDGFLYIGLGDGGGQGDPDHNGQYTNVLFGKILRLDVDSGTPYGIPANNPFAAGGGRPEIFAFGFRNPWRFSFDQTTGRLFVGDVGEDTREEVESDGGYRLLPAAFGLRSDRPHPAHL
jgi:glucose/arabinose dehydrogenase